MTFRCHFLTTKYPLPWPFANWTAKPSRPNKSLFKPHLGSQTKSLINRGWSLMRRHSLFYFFFFFLGFDVAKLPPEFPQVVNNVCVCVCVCFESRPSPWLMKAADFFLAPVCFWRQLSPHCSLRVSLKRRDWEIIWENALCGLSTLAGLRYILLSYGKASLSFSLSLSLSLAFSPFNFFCTGLWFGLGNLFNTESTKAAVSWLTLYVKVDTKKRGSVAD